MEQQLLFDCPTRRTLQQCKDLEPAIRAEAKDVGLTLLVPFQVHKFRAA